MKPISAQINVYQSGWGTVARGGRSRIYKRVTESSAKRLARLVRQTSTRWDVWPYHDGWMALSRPGVNPFGDEEAR